MWLTKINIQYLKLLVITFLFFELSACRRDNGSCVQPDTPVPTSNSPVPQGGTLKLSVNSVTGATYLWQGPNNFRSTTQNPEISNFSEANAGQYSVYIILNGCKSETVYITVELSNDGKIGFFTDSRDGKIYKTVVLGDQVWMAENFDYYTLSGSGYYKNDSLSYGYLGRLYNWATAVAVAPDGWHLPTQNDWKILSDHLGGADNAGGKLKERGTLHWLSPNTGATDSTIKFNALPAGFVTSNNGFSNLGTGAYFWTADENGSSFAYYFYLYYSSSVLTLMNGNKSMGLSIRYVKN
ncbi:MAG: FISUMP domain-containing protein [Bacteroidota bacterium]|nr:FISUMP domain-containing protein [Bacteroidota bacterium]